MRNIIEIAYQLHYSWGSECSIAWDNINHLSKRNKLTVLYGASGNFHDTGGTSEMEEWCKNHQIPNITFLPVHLPGGSRCYDFSLWGQYRFYQEYKRWHEEVARIVNDLINKEKYDLILYHGPTGYREPGFLYDMPLPYVWGPTGGFGGINYRLVKATGSLSGAFHMIVKRLLNDIQAYTDRRVKKALKNSDVVICATSESQHYIERIVGRKHHSVILYQSENCMQALYDLNEDKFKSEVIHIVFSGSVDNRKGLIFVLEALSKIPQNKKLVLDVLGDGQLRKKLEKWAALHGLSEIVHWYGMIPREKTFEIVNSAHLMVISSLHEATTTVLWEAMSRCVPIITLDHKGMRDVISENSGFKIPVHTYSQIVNDMACIFEKIQNHPDILRQKALKLIKDRMKYTWEEREAFYERVFDLADEQFKKRRNREK